MSKEGYVYVREGVWRGERLYKIGYSKDPAGRARDVRPPFPTHLFLEIYCEDCRWGEKRLHEHFAHKRIYAEWFALSSWDLQFLMDLDEEVMILYHVAKAPIAEDEEEIPFEKRFPSVTLLGWY